ELLHVTALQVTADQVTAVQAGPDHIVSSCDCQPGSPVHASAFHVARLKPPSPVRAGVAFGMTLCVIVTSPAPARLSRSPDASALRSAAPTVSACGSRPGSRTSPALLPAAATTTTPAERTCSTATVSGSAPYAGAVGRSTASARLTTWIALACEATQSSPAST